MVSGYDAVPGVEESWTEGWDGEDEDTEDEEQTQEDCQTDKPEPDEDVTLLIEDVEWEHTHGVVLLNGS